MSGVLSPSSRLVNCCFDRSLLLHPASPVHPAEPHLVFAIFHFTPVRCLPHIITSSFPNVKRPQFQFGLDSYRYHSFFFLLCKLCVEFNQCRGTHFRQEALQVNVLPLVPEEDVGINSQPAHTALKGSLSRRQKRTSICG